MDDLLLFEDEVQISLATKTEDQQVKLVSSSPLLQLAHDDSKELFLFRIPPRTLNPCSLKDKAVKIHKKKICLDGKELELKCQPYNSKDLTLFLPNHDSGCLVPVDIPVKEEISFHSLPETSQPPGVKLEPYSEESNSLHGTLFKRRDFFKFKDKPIKEETPSEDLFSSPSTSKKKKKKDKKNKLDLNKSLPKHKNGSFLADAGKDSIESSSSSPSKTLAAFNQRLSETSYLNGDFVPYGSKSSESDHINDSPTSKKVPKKKFMNCYTEWLEDSSFEIDSIKIESSKPKKRKLEGDGSFKHTKKRKLSLHK